MPLIKIKKEHVSKINSTQKRANRRVKLIQREFEEQKYIILEKEIME